MNTTWISFLNGILKMPGAKIDRKAFLSKTFRGLSAEQLQRCVELAPVDVIPEFEIEKAAKSLINSHAVKVTALSAVTGIPGGFAMLATIPADVANYYYHVVVVGQKLGYLYGFPDMIDDDGNLTQEGEIMLTAFIGVMNKVKMANELIKNIAIEMAKRLSEETAVRIAGNIMSKQIVSQAVEVIARKLGTQIAAKNVGRGFAKAIPVISGLICGGITYSTFKPQAKRLHEALKENNVGDKLLPYQN